MRGHADDRDVPGLRIVLKTPHGFPTIVVRHFEVHQDHVRVLGGGQPAALLAVLRRENLEAAAQLEASLEHVQVIVVVFDVEHFRHVADSVLLTAALITSSLDHSITSSARASSIGGTSRPIALAALRLMISSNLVGCSTGRSAGFAPLKILST